MMSLLQIERMVDEGDWARLIDRILRNGRTVGRRLAAPLRRLRDAAVVGRGLALQRACELAYGDAPFIADLAARLRASQQSSGMFGGSVVTTAIAVRALIDYQRQLDEVCDGNGDVSAALAESDAAPSIEAGLEALARHQHRDGRIGRNGIETALVLWQLGDRDAFRRAVRVTAALVAADDRAAAHLPLFDDVDAGYSSAA